VIKSYPSEKEPSKNLLLFCFEELQRSTSQNITAGISKMSFKCCCNCDLFISYFSRYYGQSDYEGWQLSIIGQKNAKNKCIMFKKNLKSLKFKRFNFET
jgi:hypothetical protein